jgi:hypothetical protein
MTSLSKNFFSKTSPDLVSLKSLNDINLELYSESIDSNKNGCNNYFNNNLYKFYKTYIQPNLIAIVIIVLFFTLIIYRYMTYKRKNKKNKKSEDKKLDDKKLDKVVEDFDPSKSVKSQINRNLYIGEVLNPETVKTSEMIEASSRYNDITHILDDTLYDDELNNISEQTGRSNFIDTEKIENVTGLNNRWNIKERDNDYILENPLGYENTFVETTGDSIQFANNKNRKVLDELAKKMFED